MLEPLGGAAEVIIGQDPDHDGEIVATRRTQSDLRTRGHHSIPFD